MSCTLRLELTDDEARELSDWVTQANKIGHSQPHLTDRTSSAVDTRSILDKLRRALKDAGVIVP